MFEILNFGTEHVYNLAICFHEPSPACTEHLTFGDNEPSGSVNLVPARTFTQHPFAIINIGQFLSKS